MSTSLYNYKVNKWLARFMYHVMFYDLEEQDYFDYSVKGHRQAELGAKKIVNRRFNNFLNIDL